MFFYIVINAEKNNAKPKVPPPWVATRCHCTSSHRHLPPLADSLTKMLAALISDWRNCAATLQIRIMWFGTSHRSYNYLATLPYGM